MPLARALTVAVPALLPVLLPCYAAAQPISWRFRGTEPGHIPGGYDVSMAFDAARNQCVFFGGSTFLLPDTFTWDGQAWTRLVVPGPPHVSRSAMVYDRARSVTVLYGGYAYPNIIDQTWEWNGQAWTQRLVSGPGLRAGHGMAYDSDRHITVLHGGGVNDTWEYDGQAWAQRTTSDAPTGNAMAYDSARHITLLVDPQGTWGWNGQTWINLAPSPTTNTDNSLAFDSDREIAVLFSGDQFEVGLTFEWDGAAWIQTASPYPSARPGNGLAYDSNRKRIVLFAGQCFCDSGGGSETWEYGPWCPADCDGYSSPAALSVLDFACFLNQFAAARSLSTSRQVYQYANCDHSTLAPVLNVTDFVCFLNAFTAGCT